METHHRIRMLLEQIYGKTKASEAYTRISRVMAGYKPGGGVRDADGYFSQHDAVLITYGETLRQDGEHPLRTLRDFAADHLSDVFSTIHLLPFFPYSSDDGFSVIDYYTVDPALGDWAEIDALHADFDLMFDFVLNHISSQSPWFQRYLESRDDVAELAIEMDPAIDLSQVTRPRAHPLLTPYRKTNGQDVHVWTTFSADQIDLNYRSLDVLEKMISVLLFYVSHGARILRLDAIAYLWKEPGTTCVHLPAAHAMVKLFRSILDELYPDAAILTETNVPHAENLSYFGSGSDEAQMVYNFTLPPLLLHTFRRADTTELSRWAAGLETPSAKTTFFNFTASHDGIGVRPLEGILPDAHIDDLAARVVEGGGQVSRKKNPDGTLSPYELNITYIDALGGGTASDKDVAQKFLASQAIQYAMPGVPATYIHSLLGSRNWMAGVKKTGRARTINREKLQVENVRRELGDEKSFRSRVFYPYVHLIRTRRRQPAFHPNARFDILDLDTKVFAMKRFDRTQEIFVLVNVSPDERDVSLVHCGVRGKMNDLLSHRRYRSERIHLSPYDYLWLVESDSAD